MGYAKTPPKPKTKGKPAAAPAKPMPFAKKVGAQMMKGC